MTNWIDYLRGEAPKFDVAIRTAGAVTRTYAALLTTAPQEDDAFGTLTLVSDVPLRDYGSGGPIGRLVLIDLAHFDSQLQRYMSPIQKLRVGGFWPRQLVELPWMNGDDIERRILEHFRLLERNDAPNRDENHTDDEPQAAIPPNSIINTSPKAQEGIARLTHAMVHGGPEAFDQMWQQLFHSSPATDDHATQENHLNDSERVKTKMTHKTGPKQTPLNPNTPIRLSREDEIDSSVTHIQVGGLFRRPANNQPENQTNAPSDVQEVTGFDYASQWPEEVKIIHEQGPFSPEELTRLSMEQLEDYYYVTCWFLRDAGDEKFVAAREKLRRFFLMRLEKGERLRPPI